MGWFGDFLTWFSRPAIKAPIITDIPVNEFPVNFSRPIPQCGLDLIKSFEKCRLEAYQDEKGVWTIGYGHIKAVKQGDTCTQEQADAWLAEDAATAWHAIVVNVKVPLTANEGGALLSWTFNTGCEAFAESTLLTILNSGNYQGVPAQMNKWVWLTMPDGTKKISNGLVNRRKAEAALWSGADWRPS